MAGSIVAATDNINVLLGGRLFQGLGVGGFNVLQVIILSDMTSLREWPF